MDPAAELLALAPTVASFALWGAMCRAFVGAMEHGRRWHVSHRPLSEPRTGRSELGPSPRVSILKPLAGADDDLADNLASFAAIDYPSFEIRLGVASPEDPAAAVARSFMAAHPEVDARLLVTDPSAALNPKVAQLAMLEADASGEVVVVSDSNVRVEPTYLTELVAALVEGNADLISSLIRGEGERTLGAALDNLQMGAHTAPGVVATALAVDHVLTIGKSLAIRRSTLQTIGGFRRVQGFLAEDHALGRTLYREGFGVGICFQPIANWNAGSTIRQTVARHVRWAKLRRSMHPFAFCFEPFMNPMVVATATFFAHPTTGSACVMALTAWVQASTTVRMMRLLSRGNARWYWGPLEIGRSYVMLFCWAAAFTGSRVQWRGHSFELGRGTVIKTPFDSSRRSIARAAECNTTECNTADGNTAESNAVESNVAAERSFARA